MYGERRSFAPIKEGDELDVTIEAVGEKGDGIAKVKGFVIFIPGAKEGENVKIKVSRVLRKVGFAEVVGPGTPQEAESKSEPAGDSDGSDQSDEEDTDEEE